MIRFTIDGNMGYDFQEVDEFTVEAVQLLQDALFLGTNGERPPGAPRDQPQAETWRDWYRRCETFLRGLAEQAEDAT